MKKIRKSELESKIADLSLDIDSSEPDPIKEIIRHVNDDDTDEAKLIKKLITPIADQILLPQVISVNKDEDNNTHIPKIPSNERLSISLRWLRTLQDAAEIQKQNIITFLKANEIDCSLIDDVNFDNIYSHAENLAIERLPDYSLYRDRYRRCKKENCVLCINGPGHGPYWYRVSRQGKQVVTSYIGKTLPPQAIGFASPQERYKSLLAQALKELIAESKTE